MQITRGQFLAVMKHFMLTDESKHDDLSSLYERYTSNEIGDEELVSALGELGIDAEETAASIMAI
jgi:chemotaxis receptor (MCP) glutamine deamidase CheD